MNLFFPKIKKNMRSIDCQNSDRSTWNNSYKSKYDQCSNTIEFSTNS